MEHKSEDGYNVQELLVQCPYEQDNPKHCQFYNLRKLSFRDRLVWEKALNQEARQEIYKKHMNCVAKCQYRQDAC